MYILGWKEVTSKTVTELWYPFQCFDAKVKLESLLVELDKSSIILCPCAFVFWPPSLLGKIWT